MQRTIMDEIFSEYETKEAETSNMVNELGWELTEAELYELGGLFNRLKDFAKKKYNQAKPLIATAKIIAKLLGPADGPPPPPPPVNDIAVYIEDQKKRHIENAPSPQNRRKYVQRPR
ncbi:hypothetical protein ACX0G7_20055 [Flavitalea antarctica]